MKQQRNQDEERAAGPRQALWGRVREVGTFEGGARIRAVLVPEDDGPPVRILLSAPPRELLAVLTLGARVACPYEYRESKEGLVRTAYRIDRVQRGGPRREWEEVWCDPEAGPLPVCDECEESPEPTMAQEQLAGGAIRRRRVAPVSAAPIAAPSPPVAAPSPSVAAPPSSPPPDSAVHRPAAVVPSAAPSFRPQLQRGPIATVLQGMERVDGVRTRVHLAEESDGSSIELRLQRAPRGLLEALEPGVRVIVSAVVQDDRTGQAVASHVARIEERGSDGVFTTRWEVDPEIAAAQLAAKRAKAGKRHGARRSPQRFGR